MLFSGRKTRGSQGVGVSCFNGSKGWFRTCLEILEQPVFSLTAKGTNCCFDLFCVWEGWKKSPLGVNEMIEKII